MTTDPKRSDEFPAVWQQRRYEWGEATKGWATFCIMWLLFCAVAFGLAPPPTPERPWVWYWPLIMFGPFAVLVIPAVGWVVCAVLARHSREAPDGR